MEEGLGALVFETDLLGETATPRAHKKKGPQRAFQAASFFSAHFDLPTSPPGAPMLRVPSKQRNLDPRLRADSKDSVLSASRSVVHPSAVAS